MLGESGCGRRCSGSDLLLGRFVSSVFLEDQCGNEVMCGNVNVWQCGNAGMVFMAGCGRAWECEGVVWELMSLRFL